MKLIQKIIEHLFGYKYYCVILNRRGTFIFEVSSYIFCSRQELDDYRQRLQFNQSFQLAEVYTFRSRSLYGSRQQPVPTPAPSVG